MLFRILLNKKSEVYFKTKAEGEVVYWLVFK